MLHLTLTDETAGKHTELGTVVLDREKFDLTSQVATYALSSEGGRVGTVEGWLECYGPWRLVQTALNSIYGGLEVQRHKRLKGDGRCNGWSVRQRRCRVDAIPGGYYCVTHEPIRARRPV